jgi:tRNA-splicing endonuclease subunit Sen15
LNESWSIFKMATHDDPLLPLARQVAHNLEHQQRWSAITIHTASPLTGAPLARPLVSGLPPRRVYVHPDEQLEMLRRAQLERERRKQSGEAAAAAGPNGGAEVVWEPRPQREWVLPADLREQWTLRRLAAVFSGIGSVPPSPESDPGPAVDEDELKWRATKRVLLAATQTDSTIVYYVVHDGITKPRMN